MTKKMVIPIVLVFLAVGIQLVARQSFGSRYHQALLTIASFALIADALWLTGKMIYAGETPLPAMPAYFWLFRFLALATIVIGFWDAARLAGVPLPGHF